MERYCNLATVTKPINPAGALWRKPLYSRASPAYGGRPGPHETAVQLDLLIEFFSQQWLLVLALAATLTMLFLHESRKAGPAVSPQQAINLVNGEGGIFLDIRDGAEYSKAHIADAKHIPLTQLGTRKAELAGFEDKPLIVICKLGQSSGTATRQLREAGFSRAQKMSGGMMEWDAMKLPVVSS